MQPSYMQSSQDLALYIRKSALRMTSLGSSSHIGSVLSCADLIAVLFHSYLYSLAENTFVMSKGHAGAAYYAALSGIGLMEDECLLTHYQNGSKLSGHVSHKASPYILVSTGSLGHGLPISCGLSLSSKLSCDAGRHFCLMSDGELNEGSNWEAFLFANHHRLDNLSVLIDRNYLQSLTSTEETMKMDPLTDKLVSFGWDVNVVDGHSHSDISNALARSSTTESPSVIIANTTKGKCVSFMEHSVLWHYRSPSEDDLAAALSELGQ